MIVELLLAWFTSIHGVVVVFALAAVAALAMMLFGQVVIHDNNTWATIVTKPVRTMFLTAVVLSALTTIPTLDDLWRVRVGLLKLELASPENVKAVGGHVEEIVKALECKHLGVNCPKENK